MLTFYNADELYLYSRGRKIIFPLVFYVLGRLTREKQTKFE